MNGGERHIMEQRRSKQYTMREVVQQIPDGSKIAIGGSLIRKAPMALVREIVRQKKRDLILYGWSAGMDFDLLIGAGCAKEAWSSYVGLFQIGMAVNFRREVENGNVRFIDLSETCGEDKFKAGAQGLTFCISKAPLHTSMMENPEFQHIITCPFTGEQYVAMEAFNPDFAFIHAYRADTYGNVQFSPIRTMDNETDAAIVKSAKKAYVSVEQIVEETEIIKTPTSTVLPKIFVDGVIEIPFGAHPNSCDTLYDGDVGHMSMYREYSKTKEEFQKYLDKYIYSCPEHEAYLELCGGISTLNKLSRVERR